MRRIIAVSYTHLYSDISQLPNHIFEEMHHFFEVYKALEHKTTAVKEIMGRDSAIAIIQHSIDNYKKIIEGVK